MTVPTGRPHAELSYDQASDPAAAANHDLAANRMTADRLVPLSSIKAPSLIVHGTADPLRPLPHGEAVATQIPGARLRPIPGMGHGFFSPELPRRVAGLILDHTKTGPGGSRPPGQRAQPQWLSARSSTVSLPSAPCELSGTPATLPLA